jgi:hypothetical protein
VSSAAPARVPALPGTWITFEVSLEYVQSGPNLLRHIVGPSPTLVAPEHLPARLFPRFHLLAVLVLGFATVMSREVLSCIHVARSSAVSLSEFRLADSLETPAAFCLIVMLIFSLLYCVLWLTESRLERAQLARLD